MSQFQQAMLLRIQCELEELKTRREAMVADNQRALYLQQGVIHKGEDFMRLADQIAATAPDPHHFA